MQSTSIDSSKIFQRLLSTTDRLQFDSMNSWRSSFADLTHELEHSMDRAMFGGVLAQSAGFAFIAGYQSAIEALLSGHGVSSPQLPLSALCISEEGGNHPKAILSSLLEGPDGIVINGQKSFVSGGCDAQILFIAVNSSEKDSERPKLKMIKIDVGEDSQYPAGMKVEAMPSFSFLPDITHGKLALDQLRIETSQVMPGDGYEDYIKPFRSTEDLHVQASILSYMMGLGIQGNWPRPIIASILACLAGLRSCFDMGPTKPETHIIMSGIRETFEKILSQSEELLKESDATKHKDWERDKAILKVAKKAHIARTEKAWSLLMPQAETNN